jgi:hypothetical protein
MSVTTERILIVILLIVAVLFATRDAHAGIIAKASTWTTPDGIGQIWANGDVKR